MGSTQLSDFFEKSTPAELREWIKVQTILAQALRKRLHKRMSLSPVGLLNSTPSELPDADEIVNETICRILRRQEDYVWDGTGTLDAFFRRSMIKSMEGLRSSERKHREASNKFQPDVDLYTRTPLPNVYEVQDAVLDGDIARERKDFARVLATVIVKARMGTTLKTYMERLPDYAQMDTEEIARDLGVKPSSVDPYRMRARRIVMKKNEGVD